MRPYSRLTGLSGFRPRIGVRGKLYAEMTGELVVYSQFTVYSKRIGIIRVDELGFFCRLVMQVFIRYLAVSLIALFAGLVATCDALVVALFYEEATYDNNGFVVGGAFVILFVLVVTGIVVFSTTTGTTRGDSARAFMGLAIIGCLTPVVMVALKLLDPGNSPQQSQVDAGHSLTILSSLIIGGVVAGIGFLGFRLLRKDDAHTVKRSVKRRTTPLYGPVRGKSD